MYISMRFALVACLIGIYSVDFVFADCENETDFMCHSDKKCIDEKLMCDHKYDCVDHSDEENCDCPEPDWYLCKDNTTCISHSSRCDGHYDCPDDDDEDEKTCDHYISHHEVTQCTKDEFKCNMDGVCLSLEFVCDGTKHCMDGSDETIGCAVLQQKCTGFKCKSGQCLTDHAWVCDGVQDCSDNSDEETCTYDCTSQNHKYLCNDGQTCIPLENVCDGRKDCPNNEDEGNECQRKGNCPLTCSPNGYCQVFPTGPSCVCPKGYAYNNKTLLCEDIDECLTFGICSQGCVNTLGGYKCTCAPRFKLSKSNNRTCKVIGKSDPILVYAASKSVSWYTLKTKHMRRIADNLNQVIGVSYDGEYIYWTDISVQVESIMKAKMDGSELQTLFTSGLGKPEDISVDHITGNIYFTDNDFQHVAVCSNEGRHCKALVTENVHRPRGIALHTKKGKMYWTDWGANPMIAVASMDGTMIEALISENIHWPNGLTIDWPNDRLYWVDAKLKSIESCKLNGKDRRSVIKNVSKHPFGIALFQDTLYWSDWDSKSIQSCNKFTGKNRTTIIRDSVIYDIHVFHPAMDGFTKNPCVDSGCSHLCLLNANSSYTCDCPKYMELSANKHTCKSTGKQKLVLLGLGNRLVIFEHQSFGRHNEGEGKIFRFEIDKMAFNSITGDVIIADNQRKIIYQVNMKNYEPKELIVGNIGNITALAFDALANNLYWTDAEHSTIEVYSFNTHHRAVVQHFMGTETPVALAVVTEVGKLFVALKSLNHTHIDIVSPNGRDSHYHALEEDIGNGPICMQPDHDLNEVFWTDYEQSKIAFTDLNGEMHHTFLFDTDNPVSLAIVGDDLFWTTKKSLKLNYTPKNSMIGTKTMTIQHPFTSPIPTRMELLAITPLTKSKHACAEVGVNGGCSHVCVAMGVLSHACLCTAGTVFQDATNTTCIVAEECYFRCGSGECLPDQNQRCDGHKNCIDGSDERNCNEKQTYVNCKPEEFTCLDGKKCVDRKQRCDLSSDCDDGSDEKDCKNYNKETKCHDNQFLCLDGKCIDSNSLCDGFKDCSDGEDEIHKNCMTSRSRTCNEGEFKCSNNQCIPTAWVCDGESDCTNDEDNCVAEKCADNMMRCDHGVCISVSLWCNGDNDCGDFSDEAHCEHFSTENVEQTCDDKMFQCKNNKSICLDMAKRCNGKADCPKGEDELDCDLCTETEFQCAPRECIPISWRCDNQFDCTNNKDEEDCGNYNKTFQGQSHLHPACSDNKYRCKDGKCVDWDRVCDDKPDCEDHSDEGGQCSSACKNSPCEYRCMRTPNGAVCDCDNGYMLNADRKSCSNINECIYGNYPCAQMCEDTVGSFHCSCFDGFALSRDKISCKSLDGQMFMFYSAHDSIYRLRPHLTKLKSTNGSKVVGLDMNFDKKLLYFSIEDSDSLYEYNWTESGQMNSVKDIGSPTQVAVDWITDNIYFIDHLKAIKVCHLANQYCVTLIEFNDGEHIKSLAVDPIHNRLFYVGVKKFALSMPRSKMYAHNLDGSKTLVITEDPFYVAAITCDTYLERIYYVGLETRAIWSVKYDGSGKQLLISKNEFITRPNEINIFESHAYVSNVDSNIVARCQLYGDRQCHPFPLNVNQPDNLVIAQKSRQITMENVCKDIKCSTICTKSEFGAKCICDFGHMVEPGEECNMWNQRDRPTFHQHGVEAASGSTAKTVLLTIFIIIGLVVLVMGGLFFYKRYKHMKPDFNLGVHFENPRSAFEAARVKVAKLNEIVINRQQNNNNRNEAPRTPTNYDQENHEFSNIIALDDTRKLLS